MTTVRQLLAAALLGKPVADYITEHRAAKMSWPKIARQLEQDTGGQVVVTAETLRSWVR